MYILVMHNLKIYQKKKKKIEQDFIQKYNNLI